MSREQDSYGNIKKGSGKVFYLPVILLIAFLVLDTLGILVIRNGEHPIGAFGYRVLLQQDGAMEGTIPTGMAVLLQDTNADKLNKGDIVAYREVTADGGKKLILRRIMDFSQTDTALSFVVKGDNEKANAPDNCDGMSVVGKYAFSMPTLGAFLTFLNQPEGFACCIGIPLLLLLVLEIVHIIRGGRRKEQEEKQEAWEQEELRLSAVNAQKAASRPSVRYPLAFLQEEPETDARPVSYQNPYRLNMKTEQDTAELEPVRRTSTVPSVVRHRETDPALYETREYLLKNAAAGASKPAKRPESVGKSFPASSKNSFNIDGIDVKVQSDTLKLSFAPDEKKKNVSVTVSPDGTSVLVGMEEEDIRFSLLKKADSAGQKVIVQKKAKPRQNGPITNE